MEVNVTKVSSRGQVVIPREIRSSLGLREGAGLLVFKVGDSIVLKSASITGLAETEGNLKALRKRIKRLGITRKDVESEIREVRRKRKKTVI